MTADKENGPLGVRSFAGVGAGPVIHQLAPHPFKPEAAGKMDIEDIEVFIGVDVGKTDHWATALNRDGRKGL